MTETEGKSSWKSRTDGGQRRQYVNVVEEVLQAIGLGNISAGEKLPSERQLAERCNASRSSVREALLVLEVSGVVQVRAGAGYFVTNVGSGAGLGVLLSTEHSPKELLEVRQIIEPAVARLCAFHANQEDIGRLGELNDERSDSAFDSPDDIDRFVAIGLAFHRELAEACGNAALAVLVNQLVDIKSHPLALLVDSIGARNPAIRLQQVHEHAVILEAIKKGQANAAAEAMLVHLDALNARIFGRNQTSRQVRRTRRRTSG